MFQIAMRPVDITKYPLYIYNLRNTQYVFAGHAYCHLLGAEETVQAQIHPESCTKSSPSDLWLIFGMLEACHASNNFYFASIAGSAAVKLQISYCCRWNRIARI
jgi:hypothetical protein